MSDYVWIIMNNLTNNPPREIDLRFGKVTDDNVQRWGIWEEWKTIYESKKQQQIRKAVTA